MIKDVSKALVFDLELTCEEPTPFGYEPEIIQVGLCYLDLSTLEITGKAQFLVKPPTQLISEFCTQLTGITSQQVRKQGVDFRVALKWMTEKYGFRRYPTLAWGDDRLDIIKQCRKFGFSPLYDDTHGDFHNLSTLASMRGLPMRGGLQRALTLLGEQFEGTPHRADDDAYNTAKVARHLFSPLTLVPQQP